MQREAARSCGTQTPHRPPVTNHTTMWSVINQNPCAAMRVSPKRVRLCGARSYKQTSQSGCHGRWFQRGGLPAPPSFLHRVNCRCLCHPFFCQAFISSLFVPSQTSFTLVCTEQVITQCCQRSPVCLYVCCCCTDPCQSSPCS